MNPTVSNPPGRASAPVIYVAKNPWSADRPKTLVVCCSDGRLQESIDEFLSAYLDIVDYDRIYMPGGPGALSEVGCQFTRTHQFRNDLQFLFSAHSFGHIVLIFHGSAVDGPEHSVCAHYRKLMPGRSYYEIVARHEEDRQNVLQFLHGLSPELEIHSFRAETTADKHVQFLDLTPGG